MRKPVKTSLIIPVELHARLSAAASLRQMDRNAFVIEAITVAVRGIVVSDRTKEAPPSPAVDAYEDRQSEAA